MMRRLLLLTMLSVIMIGAPGAVRADGIVQNASKEATKGAVKGLAQEANSANLVQGAKQVTKGMIDGVSDAAPQVTSQIVKQANVNKATMGKVARTVSGQAVAGAVDATASGLTRALGEDGDGKLADAMAAVTEKVAAALVRGIKSEIQVPEIKISPWPMVIGVLIGAFSSLFCAAGLLLLYLAFQHRRPAAPAQPAAQQSTPASGTPPATPYLVVSTK